MSRMLCLFPKHSFVQICLTLLQRTVPAAMFRKSGLTNSGKQTGSTLPRPSAGHGLDEDTVCALEAELSFLKGVVPEKSMTWVFLTRKIS